MDLVNILTLAIGSFLAECSFLSISPVLMKLKLEPTTSPVKPLISSAVLWYQYIKATNLTDDDTYHEADSIITKVRYDDVIYVSDRVTIPYVILELKKKEKTKAESGQCTIVLTANKFFNCFLFYVWTLFIVSSKYWSIHPRVRAKDFLPAYYEEKDNHLEENSAGWCNKENA